MNPDTQNVAEVEGLLLMKLINHIKKEIEEAKARGESFQTQDMMNGIEKEFNTDEQNQLKEVLGDQEKFDKAINDVEKIYDKEISNYEADKINSVKEEIAIGTGDIDKEPVPNDQDIIKQVESDLHLEGATFHNKENGELQFINNNGEKMKAELDLESSRVRIYNEYVTGTESLKFNERKDYKTYTFTEINNNNKKEKDKDENLEKESESYKEIDSELKATDLNSYAVTEFAEKVVEDDEKTEEDQKDSEQEKLYYEAEKEKEREPVKNQEQEMEMER